MPTQRRSIGVHRPSVFIHIFADSDPRPVFVSHPPGVSDLTRLTHGCWLPTANVKDPQVRRAALLRLAPANTVMAGFTAASVHGLWLPDTAHRAPVELATCSPGRKPCQMTRPRRDEVTARRRYIHDDEVTDIDGLPVTTLARTWRDLAAHLSLPDLVAAGDSALRLGAARHELALSIERGRRCRGIRSAREALPLLDRRSRSRPESHLRVAITGPALPTFEVNEAVRDDVGEWLAEPDLSLPAAKIALEYQGADHAELQRMRRDITRATDLRRAGWHVLFYGPAEVFGRPWQIVPELVYLIGRRCPDLLPSRSTRSAQSRPDPLR